MEANIKRGTLHYGWFVLIIGTFGVFAALGLGRFGYTTVLPAMQADFGISNEQAGMIAAANLIGYLTFAMLGGLMASKFGARKMIFAGLFLTGLGMILTGLSNSFEMLLVYRCITGIGSGAANISIMGLWASWFSSKKRGTAAGIAVSGSSIAIILTGLLVPYIISRNGDGAWRGSWYIYGGITLLLSIISYIVIRDSAAKKGLPLIGDQNSTVDRIATGDIKSAIKNVYLSAPVWSLGLIYIAFGFSYIIYMTFFVKYLTAEHAYTNSSASALFMTIGWFSLFCGVLWGFVSDVIGRKKTLIIIFILNAVSYAMFGIGNGHVMFVLSAVIFGLSAWSIPAVMSALCGDMTGKVLVPAALGFITLFFGIGQAMAPLVAGAMADMSGSFSSSFLLASAVSFTGAILSMIILKKEKENKE